MRGSILTIGAALAALVSTPASAGVFTDDLSRCLVSSATAEDRQALLRWIFIAAASNPGLSSLARITEAEREIGVQLAAQTFNRLILRDCRSQSVEAIRNEGFVAVQMAFTQLGQAAGREMLSGPGATAELERLAGLMDIAGLEQLGRDAGAQPATTNSAPARN